MRTVFDFWIVGPSAMGSVNGRPSSMTSVYGQKESSRYQLAFLPEPPASIASRISTVSSGVGYPAVK